MQNLESQEQIEATPLNLEISKRLVTNLANRLQDESIESKNSPEGTDELKELRKRYFSILARQILIVEKLQMLYMEGMAKYPKEAIANLNTLAKLKTELFRL